MSNPSAQPQNFAAQSEYPKYFRRSGRCIKVISPTETRTIILPPDSLVPERYTTRYPSKERLAEDLQHCEECDENKFKEFLFSFYQRVADERAIANKIVKPQDFAARSSSQSNQSPL